MKRTAFLTIAVCCVLVLLVLYISVYVVDRYTGAFDFRRRAYFPAIRMGLSQFHFIRSTELLESFQEEATSIAFIRSILETRSEYAVVRDEFLRHWSPSVITDGEQCTFMNSELAEGNIQADLPRKCQPILYAIRDDIYARIRLLLKQYEKSTTVRL